MGKKVEIPNYLTQTMEKRQRSSEVNSQTVEQSNRKLEPDTISTKKTSFYLTPAQLLKLDRLANSLNEESGGERRIDRQDIVRFLVDHCELDDLAGL